MRIHTDLCYYADCVFLQQPLLAVNCCPSADYRSVVFVSNLHSKAQCLQSSQISNTSSMCNPADYGYTADNKQGLVYFCSLHLYAGSCPTLLGHAKDAERQNLRSQLVLKQPL